MADPAAIRAELGAKPQSELVKRAKALDVSEEDIDKAIDSENIKSQLIELIIAAQASSSSDCCAGGSGELRQRRGAAKPSGSEDKVSKAPPLPENASPEEVMKIFEERMRGVLAEKAKAEGKGDTPENLEKAVNEGLAQLFEPKKKPLPGLTNETKAAKDALTADPYNLDLIYELGVRYLIDEKYTEAANVL